MTDYLWRSLNIKALNGFKSLLPPPHTQVPLTLTTKMVGNYNSYKSGTYFSPQKSVNVAWGKLDRGRWGLGLFRVDRKGFLRVVRTGSSSQHPYH